MSESIKQRVNRSGLDGLTKRQLLQLLNQLVPLVAEATYDAANLIDAAGTTTTVTVPGAALGDFAMASLGVDAAGISVTAYVSAADTVSVRLQNESGGAVDLASTTLRVRVFPKGSYLTA